MMYFHEPSRVRQSADIAEFTHGRPEARPRPSTPAGKDSREPDEPRGTALNLTEKGIE